jgi:hypothetical protein
MATKKPRHPTQGERAAAEVIDAVSLLDSLTLPLIHRTVQALTGVVHRFAHAAESHDNAEAMRRHGFLVECERWLNRADEALREALHPV